MKTAEIRKLATDEIEARLTEAREELMHLRFQKTTGELVDTTALRRTRRLIARYLTVLRERELEEAIAEEGEA